MLAAYNAGRTKSSTRGVCRRSPRPRTTSRRSGSLSRPSRALTASVPTSSAAAAAIAFAYPARHAVRVGRHRSRRPLRLLRTDTRRRTPPQASSSREPAENSGTPASTSHGINCSPATWSSSPQPQRPRTIHHVGIYVGNGYMIDAPHTGAASASIRPPNRTTSSWSCPARRSAPLAAGIGRGGLRSEVGDRRRTRRLGEFEPRATSQSSEAAAIRRLAPDRSRRPERSGRTRPAPFAVYRDEEPGL